MRKIIGVYLLAATGLMLASGEAKAVFPGEPNILNYSKVPVTITQSAVPNILVLFDNSGSMAYAAYNGRGGNNSNQVNYVPMQLNETQVTRSINSSSDDAQEFPNYLAKPVFTDWQRLDLGRYWQDSTSGNKYDTLLGLRFNLLNIPPGADILSANISFKANSYTDDLQTIKPLWNQADLKTYNPSWKVYDALNIKIWGNNVDNAATFTSTTGNVSSRLKTTAGVTWVQDHVSEPWVPGSVYSTADISPIVKEIVDRPAWASNNSMVFTLGYGMASPDALRSIYSYDGSLAGSGTPPQLTVRYSSATGTRYYGYFNSDWFYVYNGTTNTFSRWISTTSYGYKKVAYVNTTADTRCGATGGTVTGHAALPTKPQWYVRYPGTTSAAFSSPAADESTWPTACIGDAEIASAGKALWDGNFMNWATMSRVDVSRRVLTGGLGDLDAANFGGILNVESNDSAYNLYYNTSSASVIDVTPYTCSNNNSYDCYKTTANGSYRRLSVYSSSSNTALKQVNLRVESKSVYEPDTYTSNGKFGGLLQTYGDAAYWGVMDFNSNNNGGHFVAPLANRDSSGLATLATSVNGIDPGNYTPLGESLYHAMLYFKKQEPTVAPAVAFEALPNMEGTTTKSDPYMRSGLPVSCVKSFVLILTDGLPTEDTLVPAQVKNENGVMVGLPDYDGDHNAKDVSSGGTDTHALDDVALFMHTNDLRNAQIGTTATAVVGDQTVETYTIYLFGGEAAAQELLKKTAKQGGFDDLNGNGIPDDTFTDLNSNGAWNLGEPHPEWDLDGDGVPDNYFDAQDGALLKQQLSTAINSILAKSASGTSVAVISTSSEGEGVLVQAYFEPKTTGDTGGLTETKWAGHLQALWVDSKGNLREDSQGVGSSLTLDLDADKIITYKVVDNQTMINRYAVSAANNYPVLSTATPTVVPVGEIQPIWEAGKVLAYTSPDSRKIFTYTNGSIADLFGGVNFTTANFAHLKPYLGLENSTTWAQLGPTVDDRANNLIKYIRGYDSGFTGISGMRNRTIKVDGAQKTWKLGDIVNSAPVTIQAPPEQYSIIYSDKSYDDYRLKHRVHRESHVLASDTLEGWETMVYAGANDGMLHAFTGWKYDRDAKRFRQPGSSGVGGVYVPTETIGQELWAYIPRALLPHLKWLPSSDYSHSYYVDATPRVTDAKIFTADATWHINGWGTVLIGGLGLGGKDIPVQTPGLFGGAATDNNSYPVYYALDITNPREPKVLWERSYADLGFSVNKPSVVKVGENWYLAFGSGPGTNDYDGNSAHPARIYIVNLATGVPVTGGTVATPTDYLFSGTKANAFLTSATALDYKLNYSVDGIYFGETYNTGTTAAPNWLGGVYKVVVPWRCKTGAAGGGCTSNDYGDVDLMNGHTGKGEYVTTPKDALNPWFVTRLFDSPTPLTAQPVLGFNAASKQIWVYFGTGRLLSELDKSNTVTQYLYGVRDPFFNSNAVTANGYAANYFRSYTNNLTLSPSRLFDGDGYKAFFPWTKNVSPAGGATCNPVAAAASNPYYRIGDLAGNDSCISYRWECTESLPGACASAVLGQTGNINGNNSCVCNRYTNPAADWRVKAANPLACTDVKAGEVGNVHGDGSCIGMNWSCVEANTGDCWAPVPTYDPSTGAIIPKPIDPFTGLPIPLQVPQVGFIGDLYTDGTCVCSGNVAVSGSSVSVISPPVRYYWARPLGDCTNVNIGDRGIYNNADGLGGYCEATFWTCDENVAGSGACSTIDFFDTTDVDVAALTAAHPGCTCRESLDAVAHYQDSLTGSALNPITKKPYEFNDIFDMANAKDGWYRSMETPKERSVTKPAVLGGAVYFTTFVPTTDACSFGGSSYLWALYYETGTAYKKPIIGTYVVNGELRPLDRIWLGDGLASGIGIHIGFEEGNSASTYIQQSTNAVAINQVTPPKAIRSGVVSWREK